MHKGKGKSLREEEDPICGWNECFVVQTAKLSSEQGKGSNYTVLQNVASAFTPKHLIQFCLSISTTSHESTRLTSCQGVSAAYAFWVQYNECMHQFSRALCPGSSSAHMLFCGWSSSMDRKRCSPSTKNPKNTQEYSMSLEAHTQNLTRMAKILILDGIWNQFLKILFDYHSPAEGEILIISLRHPHPCPPFLVGVSFLNICKYTKGKKIFTESCVLMLNIFQRCSAYWFHSSSHAWSVKKDLRNKPNYILTYVKHFF